MRKYIFILCLFLVFSAFAQHKPTSFEAPSRMNISQIDNREFSTLIFFDYTVPEDSSWNQSHQWMNFGDKTYLAVPGSNKKYKMLSTVNMPIDSEAEHKLMLFDRPGQRHQFVLEFEKLPEDCSTFDIIEDLNKPQAFNIRNVSFNPNDSVPFVDVDSFIEDYPLKEYGQYYVNGTVVTYVKFNGIIVNSVANFLDQYGKYVCINICVQNYRDRSILFNPDNLSAIGYRHPKKRKERSKINLTKGEIDDPIYAERSVRRVKVDDSSGYDKSISIPVDVELLSYDEYDCIVRNKQKWQSFWAALGEGLAAAGAGYSSSTTNYSGSSFTTANARVYGNIGGIYGYANASGSSYTTTYGQSYTTNYNGLAAYAANQQAKTNIRNLQYTQSQIRQQIGEGYVKMHTIPSETEYSGFFNVKYNKKIQGLTYTIIIDGEPYTFYF